jgi:hypothetical protein
VIRVPTAVVVLANFAIAAYISYWHAYAVVRAHGETGLTARLEPATIDGVVYASSMVIMYAARAPAASASPGPVVPRRRDRCDARGERRARVVRWSVRDGHRGVARGQPDRIV